MLAAQSKDKDKAPLPASDLPFSQTVTVGDLIFVSGQLPLDPVTGRMAGEDIASQTRQVLANIERHLKDAGGDLTTVVKTTVFLRNLADYQEMNEEYKKAFGENRPARATVEVSDLVAGALLEIDAIAVRIEHKEKIERK
jgi:2-iminobutanoate/2-iminopropanoate deaminase